jgi:hypothetical protein
MKFTSFFLQAYRIQIIVALVAFGGIIYFCIQKPGFQSDVAWFDPISGVAMLLFTSLLWLNGINLEWKNSLPKRMTVQFQYQGRNILICYDALLVNEADARTWALQIGQQMTDCQRLKFEPYFNLKEAGIKTEDVTGRLYRSFVFTYYLKEIPVPDKMVATPEEQDNFKIKLASGCIEWTPIINADKTLSVKATYVKSTQKIPIPD